MKRSVNKEASSLGREVSLRMPRNAYDALIRHLGQDTRTEQFAFGLFSQARTSEGTLLIVQSLFLPDSHDLAAQGACAVSPRKQFQAAVYMVAQQRNFSILDIHTHPHQGVPRFSGIDERESADNAQYICKTFAPPVTHAMMVLDADLSAHDAVVYDRISGGYRTIDRLEALGRGAMIRPVGRSESATADPQFHRQTLVPGWDQPALSRQRVAIIGAGGNGAHLIQTLVAMGVGTDGWIAVVDPDLTEESNLPRIPYGWPEHVGSPKVAIAVQYAGRKNPQVKMYPYPCSVTEGPVVDRLKAATVLFGAGDRDGVRKIINEIAVRYQIPYIDMACDIRRDAGKVVAGGQVHVVCPGDNACLVCCGGYDPSNAATDLMAIEDKALHAARGYVIGGADQSTPSVANLNALSAQLAVNAFLAVVHGDAFGDWDYVHLDHLTARTITAKSSASEECPLCGRYGHLAMGDPLEARQGTSQPPTIWNKVAV